MSVHLWQSIIVGLWIVLTSTSKMPISVAGKWYGWKTLVFSEWVEDLNNSRCLNLLTRFSTISLLITFINQIFFYDIQESGEEKTNINAVFLNICLFLNLLQKYLCIHFYSNRIIHYYSIRTNKRMHLSREMWEIIKITNKTEKAKVSS